MMLGNNNLNRKENYDLYSKVKSVDGNQTLCDIGYWN